MSFNWPTFSAMGVWTQQEFIYKRVMTNKKEILIETLHGSLEPFKQLPSLIDKETIYDETGHVDTEFLTAILEWMSVNASIAIGEQTVRH